MLISYIDNDATKIVIEKRYTVNGCKTLYSTAAVFKAGVAYRNYAEEGCLGITNCIRLANVCVDVHLVGQGSRKRSRTVGCNVAETLIKRCKRSFLTYFLEAE